MEHHSVMTCPQSMSDPLDSLGFLLDRCFGVPGPVLPFHLVRCVAAQTHHEHYPAVHVVLVHHAHTLAVRTRLALRAAAHHLFP